jgi:mRNA interferase MazF
MDSLHSYAPYEVVVVPFPFTDRDASKRRPAVIMSSASFNQASGHAVMAMVTSADQSAWPGDVALSDLNAAGLTSPCVARMKLFTLDLRFVIRKAGRLCIADSQAVHNAWAQNIAFDTAPYLQ